MKRVRVKVQVPASTANLGPGFDVLALALEWYNSLEVEEEAPGDEAEPVLRVEGQGAGSLPEDRENLVYRAMRRVFHLAGYSHGSLFIRAVNRIPLARGLGSSAAAIVGGLAAADAIVEARGMEPLGREKLLALAADMEGHPDNTTAAMLGGLVICAGRQADGRLVYARLPVPFTVKVLAILPEMELRTEQARKVLPLAVSREDAVFNLGRAALLVGSILTHRDELLGVAMEDRMHQPYRSGLVPGMDEAMRTARAMGAKGVCLSGAGPTMVAFVDVDDEPLVGRAMVETLRARGVSARVVELRPDLFGVQVAMEREVVGAGLAPARPVVQKYGGSSLADATGIKRVAARVAEARRRGHDVVVVVSAMGDTTDTLLGLASAVTSSPPPARELDMLLATGEQVSIALLSMAVRDLGCPAVSLTGPQVGILTDHVHTRARILGVNTQHVRERLRRGEVVIVAGFQGVDKGGEITTLGRGGSDTTAVALAAALGADCEIYTDVDGVYTADPRVEPRARKIEEISPDEMAEMASLGAKVVQLRAVELARQYGVTVHVRSSFGEREGTLIREAGKLRERPLVRGVTHSTNEVKVVIEGVPDVPGVAARVFRPLADQNIRVDMIVQGMRRANVNDIAFTVAREDVDAALEMSRRVAQSLGAAGVVHEEDIAKVSVVGAGISQDAGVAADMFAALGERGINIDMISTSGIRISCVIARDRVEEAVRALHEKFADRMGGTAAVE